MPSVMSASRPAALMRGPSAKPKSKPAARAGSRPATWNSAATPGCMRPLRMRFSPCATSRRLLASSLTTSATVPSATRSSSVSSRGCVAVGKRTARAQLGARGQQHVEHHADAGDALAAEAAGRLVRVDDDVGVGQQHRAVDQRRQVVVGHQHLHAERRARAPRRRGWRCRCPPSPAAAAGRQRCSARPGRRWPASGRSRGSRGRARRSPACAGAAPSRRQAAQRHGAGGGAVAVVVGDDADAPAGRRSRRPAAARRRLLPCSVVGRQQARRGCRPVRRRSAHAARGQQPRQQRVHAGLLEREADARRHVARCVRITAGSLQSQRALTATPTAAATPACPACAQALQQAAPRRREARRWRVRRTASASPARRAPAALRQRRPAGRASSACPGRAPTPPSRRPAPGRAAGRRPQRLGAAARPAPTPQPLSQNELTGSSPRASRASFSGCVYSSICTSFCSRRRRRAAGSLAQPGVDVAADDAVQRRGGQRGQAVVGRRTSAAARAAVHGKTFAGEQRLHGVEQARATCCRPASARPGRPG